MPRRQHITLLMILGASAFLGIFFVTFFRGTPEGARSADFFLSREAPQSGHVDDNLLHTEAKAPKLENATLKAELGHAAWKVLHTMMAKFPDKPTEDDSAALKSYLHLFARLYPCGECARHFQKILKKFPPQVASRSTAAAWACHVHNEVNKSLKKELFDCSNIGDFYDCGCAKDEEPGTEKAKDKGGFTKLQLEKEGLTRGG
ncbi:related to ERV1 protein, mitochondrial precursor [Rhynchosporium secalis]|uniref:Sulfhydryl oxidase n=1 Tax=Rhynchosporium secalis TaxID=38038 RepID=A0A1E1M1C1_RHYSE|nr:related to ERV1 protein, mitochondrial precursor [Rhynchosporium secalis]